MKTFGILETQQLITLQVDDNDQPIFPRPPDAGDDWQPPVLVPLVKLPMPELQAGQKAETRLVWFEDRVERDWQVDNLSFLLS
jgi:hypothetical protein